MKKRKLSNAFIIIGTMLLLAALFLIMSNVYHDKESGIASREVMAELKDDISELSTAQPDQASIAAEENPLPEKLIEIDGKSYIGYLSVPALELELPVMSEWSYDNLKIAPCRYEGTVAGGDLIIAAHNYQSHFGRLKEIYNGLKIYFTDGYGEVHEYEIQQVEAIDGQDVSAMEFGSADTWDLTLFTCTLDGVSRVTVRAAEVVS